MTDEDGIDIPILISNINDKIGQSKERQGDSPGLCLTQEIALSPPETCNLVPHTEPSLADDQLKPVSQKWKDLKLEEMKLDTVPKLVAEQLTAEVTKAFRDGLAKELEHTKNEESYEPIIIGFGPPTENACRAVKFKDEACAAFELAAKAAGEPGVGFPGVVPSTVAEHVALTERALVVEGAREFKSWLAAQEAKGTPVIPEAIRVTTIKPVGGYYPPDKLYWRESAARNANSDPTSYQYEPETYNTLPAIKARLVDWYLRADESMYSKETVRYELQAVADMRYKEATKRLGLPFFSLKDFRRMQISQPCQPTTRTVLPGVSFDTIDNGVKMMGSALYPPELTGDLFDRMLAFVEWSVENVLTETTNKHADTVVVVAPGVRMIFVDYVFRLALSAVIVPAKDFRDFIAKQVRGSARVKPCDL